MRECRYSYVFERPVAWLPTINIVGRLATSPQYPINYTNYTVAYACDILWNGNSAEEPSCQQTRNYTPTAVFAPALLIIRTMLRSLPVVAFSTNKLDFYLQLSLPAASLSNHYFCQLHWNSANFQCRISDQREMLQESDKISYLLVWTVFNFELYSKVVLKNAKLFAISTFSSN